MVIFGPSGNSDSFYAGGHKSSLEMPKWLRDRGLDAYEYSCARGVRLNPDMSVRLGEKAAQYGIKISIHAPYYINLASDEQEAIDKSVNYIVETSRVAVLMGAERIVLHPGGAGKKDRKAAFANVRGNLVKALEKLESESLKVILCPETMGKKNQMGSLDEILELCLLADNLIPTFDFGHLHAVSNGGLKTPEDYRRVFDRTFEVLGDKKARNIHIHYSRIEFTEKGGERRHWTFADKQYGPEFEPLAECLIDYGVDATIISEARGTMAEDAAEIKGIYESISKQKRDGKR